ncbi:MAG: hypothetical protein FWF69_04545 [Firmicutes bacterium]|nr:hypothetical protein [Bacillota bacterium]
MKKIVLLFLAVLWALAGCVSVSVSEADEVVINVVDGHFLCGEYDIVLDQDREKPIALGYIHGDAIVQLMTEHGMEEISFGPVHVALTLDVIPYITELSYELDEIPDTDEICPICGKSTKIGNHTLLPCGHWGCLKAAGHLKKCTYCHEHFCDGKDHSPCPHCKVPWCVHVDLKCPYTRNPAPTAYMTAGPDGKPVYFHIEASPTDGGYEGRDGVKELGWAPQVEFMKTRPTQPPTPTPRP